MAKYRQIQTSFWQDSFVMDLTPEEKYFFIYVLTNTKTTQCGIYEIPLRVMEMETGYNRETVEKLISRFEEYGKILYDKSTKELCIINWMKYNLINSPKVISCIKKELLEVKNKDLIHHLYGIDTLSIPWGEEEEEKEEQEEDNTTCDQAELDRLLSLSVEEVVEVYKKDYHRFSEEQKKVINDFITQDSQPDLKEKEEEKKVSAQCSNIDKEKRLASFEKWWNLYDKKVAKQKAEALFLKLKESDLQAMRKHTPAYVKATEKQFRKNPDSYLRNACWNDEIVGVEEKPEVKKVVQEVMTSAKVKALWE